MLPNGTSIILLVLVGVVGIVIGAMLALLLTPREQQSELPPKLKERKLFPALRLWREPGSRRLVLELDGKFYTNPGALPADKSQELAGLAEAIQTWVEHPAEISKAAEAAPVLPPTSDAPIRADQAVLIPPPPADTAPALVALASQPPAFRPPVMSPPAVEPVAPVIMLPGVEVPAPAAKPLTIVGQIDAILQEILLDSPLRTRGIRLVEDGRDGVTVWVGLDHYSGIDAVPYLEVKQIIRQAVAEWERRSERDARR